MSVRSFLRRNHAALRHLTRRWRLATGGVAVVEFAMVAPAMVALYFAAAETAQGVLISRKVTQLTRSLGDLTSQGITISSAEMNDIFQAARETMQPYAAPAPRMSITSVVINNAGAATVCWNETRNGMPGRATGSAVVLPTQLRVPGTSLIIARASYAFTPSIGHLITGTIDIGNRDLYMRPRIGKRGGPQNIDQVERVGSPMC